MTRGSCPNLLPRDGEALLWEGFLAPEEADRCFDVLRGEVDWRQEHARLFGRSVALPRLTAWYADVGYRYSGVHHPPAPCPEGLAALRDRVREVVPSVNSVLANLYRDGRDSVSWHADDEPEFGPEPAIASVSLGANRRFLMRHRDGGDTIAIRLAHGSLLVMSGASQRAWQHAVPKCTTPSGERINLTFRTVQTAS